MRGSKGRWSKFDRGRSAVGMREKKKGSEWDEDGGGERWKAREKSGKR